jgi:methyltransferase-like protein
MADQLPESRFIGIDASTRQIDDGRQIQTEAGLTNVELRSQNIMEFADDHPFDFIICHGVYSWVPEDVQQQILHICRQNLTSTGVAYISYNTYPGWHMRGMIRDIMRYRARRFDGPRDKLNQARGLLTFLSNSVRGEDNPYGLLLRQELETISRSDDSYLLHEHLEDINEPIYFHEFADRAKSAGLQYLGEADFGVMSVENFPEQVQGMLLSVSGDLVETEQYMDFLRNRAFRQTLLVRDDAVIQRTPGAQSLLRLRVASNAAPDSKTVDMRAGEKVSFRRGTSTLNTTDPAVKAAILYLARIWPLSASFPELVALARNAASGQPSLIDLDIIAPATEQFARTLIRCFATSTVDLTSAASRFVTSVSDQPEVSQLARTQASHGVAIVNRRHEIVPVDDIQRRIVAACDGTRNQAELVQSMADAFRRNEFILHHEGRRITDPDLVPKIVGSAVPRILEYLAGRAMLVG